MCWDQSKKRRATVKTLYSIFKCSILTVRLYNTQFAHLFFVSTESNPSSGCHKSYRIETGSCIYSYRFDDTEFMHPKLASPGHLNRIGILIPHVVHSHR